MDNAEPRGILTVNESLVHTGKQIRGNRQRRGGDWQVVRVPAIASSASNVAPQADNTDRIGDSR